MPRSPEPARHAVPHLLAHWEQVRLKIQAAETISVFLDFDGTLVDLAPKPEMAKMSALTRKIVEQLARHRGVRIAVISGRRLGDLRRRVGVRNIRYLGLYGSEKGRTIWLPRATRNALRHARALVTKALKPNPGIWLEDKQLSFVVHWKGAKPGIWKPVRSELRRLLAPFQRNLRMMDNLRDSEVLPQKFRGKGNAVRKELVCGSSRTQLGFYFGDDLSDESAFSALRGGITVLTGKPRRTGAKFYLRNPLEVTKTLAKIEVALR